MLVVPPLSAYSLQDHRPCLVRLTRNPPMTSTNAPRARRSSLIGHAAAYAVGLVSTRAVTLLLLPLYTHALAPAEYTVLDLLLTGNALLLVVVTMGVDSAVLMFAMARGERALPLASASGFWAIVWASLCAAVLIATAGPPVAVAMGLPEVSPYLPLVAAISPFQSTLMFCAHLQRYRRQVWGFVALTVGTAGLVGVFTVSLVTLLGWGVVGALVSLAAANALMSGLAIACLPRRMIAVPRRRRAFKLVMKGVPFMTAGGLTMASPLVARSLVIAMEGLAPAAIFAAADRLAMAVKLATSAFGMAWMPRLLGADIKTTRLTEIPVTVRLFGAVLVVGSMGLILFASPFIPLFLGRHFADVPATFPPLVIAALISGLRREGLAVGAYLTEHPSLLNISNGSQLAFMIVCIPAGATVQGTVGAAWGLVASEVGAAIVMLVLANRQIRIDWPLRQFGLMMIVLIFVATAAAWLHASPMDAVQDMGLRCLAFACALALLVVGRVVTAQDLAVWRRIRKSHAPSRVGDA